MSNTLPSKCPECDKIADWIWGNKETFDEQIVQEARCSKCDTQFEENMEVTSWNRKEEQDNKKQSLQDEVHDFLLETDLLKFAQENFTKDSKAVLDQSVLGVLQAVEDLEKFIIKVRDDE